MSEEREGGVNEGGGGHRSPERETTNWGDHSPSAHEVWAPSKAIRWSNKALKGHRVLRMLVLQCLLHRSYQVSDRSWVEMAICSFGNCSDQASQLIPMHMSVRHSKGIREQAMAVEEVTWHCECLKLLMLCISPWQQGLRLR